MLVSVRGVVRVNKQLTGGGSKRVVHVRFHIKTYDSEDIYLATFCGPVLQICIGYNADPHPAFEFNADPNPDSGFFSTKNRKNFK